MQGRTQDLRFGRSPVHAWGLFAKQDIEPEEFIVEYVGQVRTLPPCQTCCLCALTALLPLSMLRHHSFRSRLCPVYIFGINIQYNIGINIQPKIMHKYIMIMK